MGTVAEMMAQRRQSELEMGNRDAIDFEHISRNKANMTDLGARRNTNPVNQYSSPKKSTRKGSKIQNSGERLN